MRGEGWKVGRLEGWKVGGLESWRDEGNPPSADKTAFVLEGGFESWKVESWKVEDGERERGLEGK